MDYTEAQIISETNDSEFLRSANSKLFDILDSSTQGKKGFFVTEGLIASELADKEIRKVYKSNPDAFNAYFEHINMQKVARSLEEPIKKQAAQTIKDIARQSVPGLVVGTITGFIIAKQLSK